MLVKILQKTRTLGYIHIYYIILYYYNIILYYNSILYYSIFYIKRYKLEMILKRNEVFVSPRELQDTYRRKIFIHHHQSEIYYEELPPIIVKVKRL